MPIYYKDSLAVRKASAKYVLPYVIGIFTSLLIGQIAGEFFTVKQLNKVSGKITNLETKAVSMSGRRGRFSNRLNYALIITLNNNIPYYIEDDSARKELTILLHKGDDITIYYPTILFKILNAGFVHSVNQIERNGQVVYSFDKQKEMNYAVIFVFALFIGVFYVLRKSWL